MPLMRLPGARIAVVTTSDADSQTMAGLLAQELTTVVRYRSVEELIPADRPDIVIVSRDLVCDGALALRRLRQRWLTCTLIVTGATSECDAAQLLDIGADNALIAGDALLAPRLRAAARRARTINKDLRTVIGDVMYDRESRRVWCAGRELRLTRTEEALLDCLFWYAPDPASIAELTAFAWGRSTYTERRNLVHVYMGYLRRKLHDSRQVEIHTIRGAGYKFAERLVTMT
jgi:DNA-binding response OmpR family regulator